MQNFLIRIGCSDTITVGPALIKDCGSKKAMLFNASMHFKAQFYKEIHHIHLEKNH